MCKNAKKFNQHLTPHFANTRLAAGFFREIQLREQILR